MFADATTTELSLAYEIRDQLRLSVPDYPEALGACQRNDPEGWHDATPIEAYLTRPLGVLAKTIDGAAPAAPVRVVIDGLDQLRSPHADGLIEHLLALADHDDLPQLRVVVGIRDLPDDAVSRSDLEVPADAAPSGQRQGQSQGPEQGPGSGSGQEPGPMTGPTDDLVTAAVTAGKRLRLPTPAEPVVARYLQGRRVPLAGVLASVCVRAESAWLLARLLADTATSLTPTERDRITTALTIGSRHDLVGVVEDLYDRVVERTLTDLVDSAHLHGTIPESQHHAERDALWAARIRPVLTVLAVAGSGPVTPLPVLTAVCAALAGPTTVDAVRAVLDDLDQGRLLLRVRPGTDAELVGLFHPTLAEHLSRWRDGRRRVDVTTGRRILLDELDTIVPAGNTYADNPLSRWAAEAEPEHLFATGDYRRLVRSLLRRPLLRPADELARWTRWHQRLAAVLRPRDVVVLDMRYYVAHWTGETGDPAEALRLYRELLPDRQAVLGHHHPDTLAVEADIARLEGSDEDPGSA